MNPLLRIAEVLIGALLVALFFRSIIATSLLSRHVRDPIHDYSAKACWAVFRLFLPDRADHARLDRRLAWFWPLTVFVLMASWYLLVMVAFTFFFRATGLTTSWVSSFIASGSALSTLGFKTPPHPVGDTIALAEAGIGLFLVVYVLSFVPGKLATVQASSDRTAWAYERAGTPITAVGLLEWFFRSGKPESVEDTWGDWESWFRQIGTVESISLGLITLRSHLPNQYWICAAGAVLDSAALSMVALGSSRLSGAYACWRTGVRALRSIVDALGRSPDALAERRSPTLITRADFETALGRLAAAGAPIPEAHDEVWSAFIGMRAEYEPLLVTLAEAAMVDLGPWLPPGSDVAR